MAGFLGDTASPKALSAAPGSHLCFQPDCLASLAAKRETLPRKRNTHREYSREAKRMRGVLLAPRPINGKNYMFGKWNCSISIYHRSRIAQNLSSHKLQATIWRVTTQRKEHNKVPLELLYKLCIETETTVPGSQGAVGRTPNLESAQPCL